jgi:hypothetical protein
LISVYRTGTAPNWLCQTPELTQIVRQLGVTSIIADDGQPHIRLALHVIDTWLDARPRQVGGVWLWRCTGGATHHPCHWS